MKLENWTPLSVITTEDPGANLDPLAGKTLAVIGFGSQGHAHALNLKDVGMHVIIGLQPESKSIRTAREYGFDVFSPVEAVDIADVILIAVPDMVQEKLFEEEINPMLNSLPEGAQKTFLFSHGLAIRFRRVVLPETVAVAMVAPKGPGHLVRSQALKSPPEGTPALIAVHQDPFGTARDIALAWAHGIGATRAGVLETTFKEEAETDLFGEQTVLCGGVVALMQTGFNVLVEAGYRPEMAYFECFHELKLTVDLLNQGGVPGMYYSVSETAKWGGLSTSVIGPEVKERMCQALEDIQDGTFVRNWAAEYGRGLPNYSDLLKMTEEGLLEKVGKYLRSLMPWLPKIKMGGVQADTKFNG